MDLQERNVTFEPNPYWPDRFDDERELVRDVSGNGLLGVFHVGSTAIPEVPGKPALDVIAVYETTEAMEAAAETLVADHGFERPPESTVVLRWEDDYGVFVKLHTSDDEKVRNQLAFRDYLRDDPNARQEYARVKREAAETHRDDLEGYTQAKSQVVKSLLQDAREQGYFEQLPEFV